MTMQSATTRSNRGRGIVAACFVGALALTACGKAAEKIAEKGVERAIENETGGDVNVDLSGDGGFVFESDEGSVRIGEDGSFVIEGQDGEVITGEANDGGVNIQSEDGESSFQSYGEIPPEWPTSEVPAPNGLTDVSSSVSIGGGQTVITASGTPTASPGDFFAGYGAALEGAGFERTSYFEGGGSVQATFVSAAWSVNVVAIDDNSTVAITLFPAE